MNDQALTKAVTEISEEYWAEQNSPVLLSGLPKKLEAKLPDYRLALGARSLKAFIRETEINGSYKLIEHPTLKAKIGVAPSSATYEFPQEPTRQPKRPIAPESNNNQAATLAFLRALATLPESDLERVVIPVSVLTKLLK